jgi:D-alanyl-D-alanine carboxypeptidase
MKMKKWMLFLAMIVYVSGCDRSTPSHPIAQNQEKEVKPQEETINETPSELLLEEKFWNQIEVQNGIKVIVNPENILALVNKEQSLPSNYKPSDLVIPNVPFTFAETNVEKRYMRAEAAKALEEMFTKAKEEQIFLYAVSGYRSYERQKALFDAEVNRVGKDKAVMAVAIPGRSEHQTGLAVDITSL